MLDAKQETLSSEGVSFLIVWVDVKSNFSVILRSIEHTDLEFSLVRIRIVN